MFCQENKTIELNKSWLFNESLTINFLFGRDVFKIFPPVRHFGSPDFAYV